ncbi:Ser/Thr protein phosphatase [Histomonas meleagridis]|uniref:Ser/Thr protein phosphatase n=1 Tax=Histomonas meleagridis TaxID=135588 RepID=UPI00355A8244|nr:Ser/Thr protein phosphatase [Histomonas meleagridis]KAH0804826.1 Ser/Thr protein phosphatase [Histomonas meleagridis]
MKINPNIPKYRALLDAYLSVCESDIMKYAEKEKQLILPIPEQDLLQKLFQEVKNLFMAESTMLEIRSPCIIVGDIHGHLLDLLRIIQNFGLPGPIRYVFLGDLIDRGEFSIETLIIVFLLKVLFPTRVFIIRGNHEFATLCSQCGFLSQMFAFFGDMLLYYLSIQTFEYIPLAALIDKQILCIHGGLDPNLNNVDQIRSVKRPISEFTGDFIDSLVWSDPTDNIDDFEVSSRGSGYTFGCKALKSFLSSSKIEMLVRGHECVFNGCKYHFDGRLVTVFSASNYCGMVGNEAGVLVIHSPMNYEAKTFPPLKWLLRTEVTFISMKSNVTKKVITKSEIIRTKKTRESASTRPLHPIVTAPMKETTNSARQLPKLEQNQSPRKEQKRTQQRTRITKLTRHAGTPKLLFQFS